MACLRESPPDGRFGTLSCDEEGCLFRCIKNPSNSEIVELSPETDCVLQLQLRAGDPEDTGGRLIIESTTAHNPRFRNLSLDREPNAFGYGFREHLWRCSHCDTLHREWTQSDHICPVCGTANNIEQRRLDVQPESEVGDDQGSIRREGVYPWGHGLGEADRYIQNRKRYLDGTLGLPEPEVGDDRDAGDGSKFLFPKSVLRAADRAAMGLPPESGGDEGERPTEVGGDGENAPDGTDIVEFMRRVVRSELIMYGIIPDDDGYLRPPPAERDESAPREVGRYLDQIFSSDYTVGEVLDAIEGRYGHDAALHFAKFLKAVTESGE